MNGSYTEKQLKSDILSQKIGHETFYYTLAQKDRKNLSFLSNDRLLVLNFDEGHLYYVNEYANVPFHEKVPLPKKQYADLLTCIIRKIPEINGLEISYAFENEKVQWKFQFERESLAEEWMKLIELQRTTDRIKKDQIKPNNILKSVMQFSKFEDPFKENIIKDQSRNILLEENKMIMSYLTDNRSRVREPLPSIQQTNQTSLKKEPDHFRKKEKKSGDWNYKFFKERSLQTIYAFQIVATAAFKAAFFEDQKHYAQPLRQYEDQAEQITVYMANIFSEEAKKLQRQFRNYHFILEATRDEMIIGVPLTCLIKLEAVVALVKAKFPLECPKYALDMASREEIKNLQRYTRVRNKILQKASLYDLGEQFLGRANRRLLYVDNLIQYLPINLSEDYYGSLIRPEFILDNVKQYIPGGEINPTEKPELKIIKDLSQSIASKAKTIADYLSAEEIYLTHSLELKTIMHEHGLNLRYLPLIYAECTNPHLKKMISTAMVVKILVNYVIESVARIKIENSKVSFANILEDTLGLLVEGNNNKSNEIWKQIYLVYKKRYNIAMNHKEIVRGFFLNSLMREFGGDYNLGKLDGKKKLFEDRNIIEAGFLRGLQPKIKSYYRMLSDREDKLRFACKGNLKDQILYADIVTHFALDQHNMPRSYQIAHHQEWVQEYLSLFIPPQQLNTQKELAHLDIYQRMLEEPPSSFTVKMSRNYLEWCIKREQPELFKSQFEKIISVMDYWLEQIHPIRSDLYQLLSEYYFLAGSNEDMIKYMKDSLNNTIKFAGAKSKFTGLRQYELADRYFRIARIQDAKQYFQQAKANIEFNRIQTNKYGLIFMKLGSIYLSEGEYEKAIEFEIRSIKNLQEYERKIESIGLYHDPFKIKAFEVLARAYEIVDKKTEYKELAIGCARKFNKANNFEVYEQMVKICLAASIFRSSIDRNQSLIKLVNKINNEENKLDPFKSLDSLMAMSQEFIVMEKFMIKFQHFERSLHELNIKKRNLGEENNEFLRILTLVVGVVGQDYINGLIQQKEYL